MNPHEPHPRPTVTMPRTLEKLIILIYTLILTLWWSPPVSVPAVPPVHPLTGHVTYTGSAVPDQVIAVTRDTDFCGKTVTTRRLSVDETTGGVEGAVVVIENAPARMLDPDSPPLPLVITNSRCAFLPRIMAGRVGHMLEIRNDDPVLHNTHITADRRTFLNVALVPGGRPVKKPLTQSGVYAVTCDAHKFMTAHLIITAHPYVGVTDQSGTFRLPDIPPGTYSLTVWHETLGTLQQEITVPHHGLTPLTIAYPRDAANHVH